MRPLVASRADIPLKLADDCCESKVGTNAPTLKLLGSPFLATSRLTLSELTIRILKDVKCTSVV